MFVCLNHINVRAHAHAGYIGTDRNLLTEHDALLIRQIARNRLHALSHRHNKTSTAFGEPVVGTF